MNQYPSFGSSHIDQPREPKGHYRDMNRAEALESDQFRLMVGEQVRDKLEDMEVAIMAYYMEKRDDEALGRYVRETLKPVVESCIEWVIYDAEPVGRVDPEDT
jgi:hypothetical protein